MDLPLPDGSQDAVISQEALLHVPDLERTFREAHRVLRAGGRLAFTNWIIHRPLSEPQRQLLRDGMAAATLIGIDRHVELLRDAGFEIEATGRNGGLGRHSRRAPAHVQAASRRGRAGRRAHWPR